MPHNPTFPLTKIVEVLWEDITTTNSGWITPNQARTDFPCVLVRTVGYVLEDSPKLLKLVMLQSEAGEGEVGVIASIPKGVILRSKVLKGL